MSVIIKPMPTSQRAQLILGPCATSDCNTGRVRFSNYCEKHNKGIVIAKMNDATIEKYTKNGEITFNTETKEYTVWDENYSDTVCVTNYPKVAEAALDAYAKHYL